MTVSIWSSRSLSHAWTRSGCASACQSSTSVRVAAASGIDSTGPGAVSAKGSGVARPRRAPAASSARQRSAGVSASASVEPGRLTENVRSMRSSSSARPRLSKPRSSPSLLSRETRGVSRAERSSRDRVAIRCSRCAASSGALAPLPRAREAVLHGKANLAFPLGLSTAIRRSLRQVTEVQGPQVPIGHEWIARARWLAAVAAMVTLLRRREDSSVGKARPSVRTCHKARSTDSSGKAFPRLPSAEASRGAVVPWFSLPARRG